MPRICQVVTTGVLCPTVWELSLSYYVGYSFQICGEGGQVAIIYSFKYWACSCSLQSGWFWVAWLLEGDCGDGYILLHDAKNEVMVPGPAFSPSYFPLSSFWVESNKMLYVYSVDYLNFSISSFSPGHHCYSQAVKDLSEVTSTFKLRFSYSGKIVESI